MGPVPQVSRTALIAFWEMLFGGPPSPFPREDQEEPPGARFHNLPGDDRWPRCKADREEVLRRQNAILTRVLGSGMAYAQVLTEWPVSDFSCGKALPFMSAARFELLADVRSDDECEATMYWAPRVWQEGSLDALLLAVADDKLSDAYLVGVEQQWVAKPYDGGLDLFSVDADACDRLAEEFAGWLPGACPPDELRIARASRPDERDAIEMLVKAGADICLNDGGSAISISMDGAIVTDRHLEELSTLRCLEALRLGVHEVIYRKGSTRPAIPASSEVTDRGVSALAALRALKWLTIPEFPNATSGCRANLLASLPNLVDAES